MIRGCRSCWTVRLAALAAGDVYGGGGDDKTMLRLTVGELVRVAQPCVIALNA